MKLPKEIQECPTCGTPNLNNKRALVLYFETDQEREAVILLWKELHPNGRSLKLKDN